MSVMKKSSSRCKTSPPSARVQAVKLSMFTPRSHCAAAFGSLRFSRHQLTRRSPVNGSCAIQAGTGTPLSCSCATQRTAASLACASCCSASISGIRSTMPATAVNSNGATNRGSRSGISAAKRS